jgi:hypothetical protein
VCVSECRGDACLTRGCHCYAGDVVNVDDIIAVIETDKVTVSERVTLETSLA